MASSSFSSSPANQPSLPSLPAHLQDDVHLTAHLASRFHLSLPVSSLSSHALISINTYTSSTRGPDGGKDGSPMAEAELLARRAFTRLGARAENQAVLFLGESGSGKTTLRSHLLSALLSFSSTPLSTKLSYSAFLFDTLTSTKSLTTPTASKAGLFFELQYDASSTLNPCLIGGKLLDHRLERSRLTRVPTGERSFHVLYYLLAGTSPDEKEHLGLHDPIDPNAGKGGVRENVSSGLRRTATSAGKTAKRWRYLGHPTQLKVGINDAQGFSHFKTALKKLEFPRAVIAQICQILACILHIGQLEFATGQATTTGADESGGYSHEGGETVTVVKNKSTTLTIIAAFLGLSVDDLENSLAIKSKTIRRERVTVMLDPKRARDNADELATTLYALLVAYIIESINQRTCAPDEDDVANTISVVDFPGFCHRTADFTPASHSASDGAGGFILDQLFTNAANEALYNFCLRNFFDTKADMLETEEVVVGATSYFDNSDTVRGLLKHGNGVLSILDDQTRRGRTDAQFLESLRKRFGDGKVPSIIVGSDTEKVPGSNFRTPNRNISFTIQHFAGPVEYPVAGLIEENAEVVSADLINLIMRGSRNDFVHELLFGKGSKALSTVAHPADKSAILQAQISSMPSRMPSMAARKGGRKKRRDGSDSGSLGHSRLSSMPEDAEPDDPSPKEHKKKGSKAALVTTEGAAGQFLAALDNITHSLTHGNSNPYFIFCIKPNDRRIANQFDSVCVRTQIQTFGIPEISQRLKQADVAVFLPFAEFLGLAEAASGGAIDVDAGIVGSEREKTCLVVDEKRWMANEALIGSTGIFLSERCWVEIAGLGDRIAGLGPGSGGRGSEDDEYLGVTGPYDSHAKLLGDDHSPGYNPGTYLFGSNDVGGHTGYLGARELDGRSDAGTSVLGGAGGMFQNMETREQMAEKGNEKKMEEVDELPVSGSRKRWLFIVSMMTWFVPDWAVRVIGKMKRPDIRLAWREKFAINLLIWLFCAVAIFYIIGFPLALCPTQHVYSSGELTDHNGKNGADSFVSLRGRVFDLGKFAPHHYVVDSVIPKKQIMNYAGKDVTGLFPVQVSALCEGINGPIDPTVVVAYKPQNMSGMPVQQSTSDMNYLYHDFRYFRDDYRPDWYREQMHYLKDQFMKGHVGYTKKYLKKYASKESKYVSIIDNYIYDLTDYVNGNVQTKDKPNSKSSSKKKREVDTQFLDSGLVGIFQSNAGQDVSKLWRNLPLSDKVREQQLQCLKNLFMIGVTDERNSPRCKFVDYLVLAISCFLGAIIVAKFLAALQFGRKNVPENLDRFVMCQVPVYTEDEDSLRRAIDSMARMKYDDKRKLLVVICDGMIIGQGNDRPTPRIVLDILGVSETVDPEPLSFESLGEGQKQHNMGKVYSGLYEVQGHIVPFLVVVKVGKPSEVSRPGNRGKRDSQMVMMRFLNRVHYNLPMTPMELEMHHHIRNIIGVNPTFYEFILQVDADTVVAPDACTRFVASMLGDIRILGICGETSLSNARSTMTTMIQVYEYYISHNLTKAFESLFGSVTCLPGCFSMYRIRSADTGKPLFVSKEVVDAYAEIRVDTLHMKNLLHLGEDRYLTTLLIKNHPKYKTKFLFGADAYTIAPDQFSVFLSQRRRWINSTVHNLVELVPMQQLCGFCCFSMRFVIFIDLISTIAQPVIMVFLVYLFYKLGKNQSAMIWMSFLLLAIIYGLQAVIFLLRRRWDMIAWMFIYMLATPVFTLALPLYSFWHMDDFSWGSTRVITGEKGQKVVVSDEGKFDPANIPKKRWDEYQNELWDSQSSSAYGYHDDGVRSESGLSYATKSYHPAMSAAGGGATPDPYAVQQQRYSSASPYNRFGGGAYHTNTYSGGASDMVEMTEFTHYPQQHELPTDDQILFAIKDYLATADLMTVTKKTVRNDLEQRFGCNLEAKRHYINSATEAVLSGQI